jgi:hypothetical protein
MARHAADGGARAGSRAASHGPPRRLEQEQQLHGFSMIVAQGGRGICPALVEEGEDEAELFLCAPLVELLLFDSVELVRKKRGGGGGPG